MTWQALLSALVLRVRAGHRVRREDVVTLLDAGVGHAELLAAFAEPSESSPDAARDSAPDSAMEARARARALITEEVSRRSNPRTA